MPRCAKLNKNQNSVDACVWNDLAIANQTSCRNVTHVEVHMGNNGNLKKMGG